MSQALLSTVHTDSTIRSNLYKLLSFAFRYPTPEIFKTFQDGEFLAKLWNCISLLSHIKPIMVKHIEVSKRAQNHLHELTFADFKIKHIQTFTSELMFPIYRKEDQTIIMLDTVEYLKYFGLIMNKEDEKYRLPEHLCAVLEFLSFLTFREAESRVRKDHTLMNSYIAAQKNFLERHIVQWVPKFCNLIQDSMYLPFYQLVARTTSVFIILELELITSGLKAL